MTEEKDRIDEMENQIKQDNRHKRWKNGKDKSEKKNERR